MATVAIPMEKYEGQSLELHHAAKNNDLKKLKLLLLNGGDIDEQDGNGSTALIYASSVGNLEAVKYLVENGANKEVKDNLGYDAYQAAMFYGDYRGATIQPFNQILALTKHGGNNT